MANQPQKPKLTYYAGDQIERIKRLQQEAAGCVEKAKNRIKEANKLAVEIKKKFGNRIVCEGIVYKIEYKAIGWWPGNHNRLEIDKSAKIVQYRDK